MSFMLWQIALETSYSLALACISFEKNQNLFRISL